MTFGADLGHKKPLFAATTKRGVYAEHNCSINWNCQMLFTGHNSIYPLVPIGSN